MPRNIIIRVGGMGANVVDVDLWNMGMAKR